MIISQPKTSFLESVFDVDHDFEGPRAPKAHLDTVNRNLLDHLVTPFIILGSSGLLPPPLVVDPSPFGTIMRRTLNRRTETEDETE